MAKIRGKNKIRNRLLEEFLWLARNIWMRLICKKPFETKNLEYKKTLNTI